MIGYWAVCLSVCLLFTPVNCTHYDQTNNNKATKKVKLHIYRYVCVFCFCSPFWRGRIASPAATFSRGGCVSNHKNVVKHEHKVNEIDLQITLNEHLKRQRQ